MSSTNPRLEHIPPVRRSAKVIQLPIPKRVKGPRIVRLLGVMLVMMLIGAILERWYLEHWAPTPPEEIAGIGPEEKQVFELINEQRTKAGVPALKVAPKVTVIARSHSYDMALRRYMAHVSPSDHIGPEGRLRGNGIHYQVMGENVYEETFPDHSTMASRVVKGWMSSPDHRANILSPDFTETGIGVAYSSNGETYVTEDFIR